MYDKNGNVTIRTAEKAGVAVKVEMDHYLLEDGRDVKYDRYCKGSYRWKCSDGYAYRCFHECYFQSCGAEIA